MLHESKQETKGQEIQKAAPARALSPFEEMDRMFDSFFRRGWMRPWRFEWPGFPELTLPEMKMPKVDVIDRENEIVVKAEVPGVDKKDIDISVGEDTVTIKGETHHEEKEEKGDYYRCEISRGAFARTVALPAAVDGAKAKAAFKDGVLELTLPKIEKAKRHTVKVE
jgi:HSP20 family protein